MSKLTDHKMMEGKLVTAWTEPSYRRTDRLNEAGDLPNEVQHDESRFRFVVDELDHIIAGGLTEQYTLVQNREFISALDLAADERGLTLEPRKAVYRNGRGLYEFSVSSHRFQVVGDPSVTDGLIQLGNDYRGQGGLRIQSGWFRMICTNGVIAGVIAHKDTKRHVGEIDVYRFVATGLDRFVERFEVERLLAETLGKEGYTPAYDALKIQSQADAKAILEVGDDLLARILADTPDRYIADVQRAVCENQSAVGETLWGVIQAVSEIATHRMQETATGDARANYSFAADSWGSRQLELVRALVEA
jgi:hypothetical protein